MNGLLIRAARVVTFDDGSDRPRRGAALSDLGLRDGCDVRCSGGNIVDVGRYLEPQPGDEVIDARGRVLVPGFVDAHTHLCWAGSRIDEWEKRLAGASYLELLSAGGGIMSTVRAVRAATEEELVDLLMHRLARVLANGTTTIEVKSGYGLDTASELKMLHAITTAGSRWPGTVLPTACIGHALDPDVTDAAERTIRETLPAVHASFPGVAIDAYCENGAWSVEQCTRLFDAAMTFGHPCRVHADQFTSLGMTRLAAEKNFISVDHLEAATQDDRAVLARSETFGVMLPCSGLHVDRRFADGRSFIDAGGLLAIATNANPGSAPCLSMPEAMALAVRFCGLTAHEALACSTVNPAALLRLADRGRIAPGMRADLTLLSVFDERELAHTFGEPHVSIVACEGKVVHQIGM